MECLPCQHVRQIIPNTIAIDMSNDCALNLCYSCKPQKVDSNLAENEIALYVFIVHRNRYVCHSLCI